MQIIHMIQLVYDVAFVVKIISTVKHKIKTKIIITMRLLLHIQ